VQPTESCDILEDEAESVPGRLAEECIGESNLDVSILRDEFDAFLQQDEKVSSVAEQASNDWVLGERLNLPAVVFEEES